MGVGKVKDNWEYLDGELMFQKWMELGSLSKVQNWMIGEEMVNPATGEPPTKAGIRIAARRWMAYHQEEAKKFMAEQLGEEWVYDQEQWAEWMVQQARGSLGNAAYETWVHDNGYEKYAGAYYAQ